MRGQYFILLLLSFVGVTATASQPEQRIIALSPHLVENLYAIGAGDDIVATVDYANHPEQAQQIMRIGGHQGIQLEKVLALKPTLVVAWQGGNKAADIEALQRLGIPLYVSKIESLEDISAELRALGHLTHRQSDAEHLAAQFDARLARLQQQYDKAAAMRPKVFYQLWPTPMMTVSNNTLIGKVITLCGGDNVFADNVTDYPQISLEHVVLTEPDVIIVTSAQQAQQASHDWQQWQSIPAVKYGAIHAIDADVLHRYSTRILNGVQSLCEVINE
ncbi:cobalamin-binding protein [Pseudoalteromonas sp. SSDWG2]|uniref:cobalamin-binding protein n=1 Tax=Pseudoalteromonas sp. SSDWG2 TaxID=3139391 RepID=UPI003BAA7330